MRDDGGAEASLDFHFRESVSVIDYAVRPPGFVEDWIRRVFTDLPGVEIAGPKPVVAAFTEAVAARQLLARLEIAREIKREWKQ